MIPPSMLRLHTCVYVCSQAMNDFVADSIVIIFVCAFYGFSLLNIEYNLYIHILRYGRTGKVRMK